MATAGADDGDRVSFSRFSVTQLRSGGTPSGPWSGPAGASTTPSGAPASTPPSVALASVRPSVPASVPPATAIKVSLTVVVVLPGASRTVCGFEAAIGEAPPEA
jgi:hypothetical protein